MDPIQAETPPNTDAALAPMIEPLAGYICAADRPRAALRWALAALFDELEQTKRAANAHVDIFLEKPRR